MREGATGPSDECASAAAQVYDKLHSNLDPLIGASGVQSLLVRSAKLTQSTFSFLETSTVEGSERLRDCLRAQDPTAATDAAAALFGTFFDLLTTFIGDRLTHQALRNAWPEESK